MKTTVDKLLDMVLSLVARLKEEHYAVFTFELLMELAGKLRKACSEDVAGYKCYVVPDTGNAGFKIGIFPVDSQQNTFGGDDVVMKIVTASAIDEKLRSLTGEDSCGSFFIPRP